MKMDNSSKDISAVSLIARDDPYARMMLPSIQAVCSLRLLRAILKQYPTRRSNTFGE
jgi:hypothetical protein